MFACLKQGVDLYSYGQKLENLKFRLSMRLREIQFLTSKNFFKSAKVLNRGMVEQKNCN